jgi:two-component system, sensor histidine kinase and response regulator
MVPADLGPVGPAKRRRPPVKFLLVDDKEENLIALEALLRREGLEILKAHSGDEALELLLQHDVALALLDVHMPDMDGFALAELMRGAERSRHVPIIFVTAGAVEPAREFRGYDAGAVDFLFKPVDPLILRHKTETFFELYRQRQQLEETLSLAETFMAAVGHDLKTPLNAIALGTELILGDPGSDANRRTAERLRTSTRRMQRMIDDLFDLARARMAGGIDIERAPTDLGVVVKRVIAEIETAHPGHVVTLQQNPAQAMIAGEWDADRLARVVANLLSNAVRHGRKNGPISVILSDEKDAAAITIHNEGKIADEVMPELFAPFRARGTKRAASEGLGLGLFIVEQIVVAHGGTINVTSSADEGTTFKLRLPKNS